MVVAVPGLMMPREYTRSDDCCQATHFYPKRCLTSPFKQATEDMENANQKKRRIHFTAREIRKLIELHKEHIKLNVTAPTQIISMEIDHWCKQCDDGMRKAKKDSLEI